MIRALSRTSPERQQFELPPALPRGQVALPYRRRHREARFRKGLLKIHLANDPTVVTGVINIAELIFQIR